MLLFVGNVTTVQHLGRLHSSTERSQINALYMHVKCIVFLIDELAEAHYSSYHMHASYIPLTAKAQVKNQVLDRIILNQLSNKFSSILVQNKYYRR